jgi:hypothetical protein
MSIKELNAAIKVWLCTEKGQQIAALPMTSGVTSVDTLTNNRAIGRKLVLCVSDGSSKVMFGDFAYAYGIKEDMAMITVRPDELPESVLGYDAVDAIVWMSGDAHELTAGGSARLPAMTEYIRHGGKLVVTQPADRSKVETLDALLPIQLKDAAGNWLIEERDRSSLAPLRDWVKPVPGFGIKNPWLSPRGTFKVARASVLRPGALVVAKINWNDDQSVATPDETPYLVRWGVGLGDVTWVAQNLGDINITSQAQSGWIGIWDKVFDVKNDPRLLVKGAVNANDQITDAYGEGTVTDLGRSFTSAMNHPARGATLVVVAIGFFVIYWVIAGPVAFLVLAGKKRKGMSWPIFAVSAIVATLLNVIVERVVKGASADIHHISFVRIGPGEPAVVESRLGIYLTKSGYIPVALEKTDPNQVSYLSAFAYHPSDPDFNGHGYGAKEPNTIPISEAGSAEPVKILEYFRSTLKKMQSRWVGNLPGIDGRPTLIEATEFDPAFKLTGRLTNSTGRDLTDVYFGFQRRDVTGTDLIDELYYLPKWPKDGMLNLDKDLTANKVSVNVRYSQIEFGARPGDGKIIGDVISLSTIRINRNGGATTYDRGWTAYWNDALRGGSMDGKFDPNVDSRYRRSFPMASLFDRLAVVANSDSGKKHDRYDLLRRGARRFDMSPSMAAGELVILAQDAANDVNGESLSPLPIPLKVDGDAIAGTGVTFYQIALPLARQTPAPPPAATQPATQPVAEKP